LPVLVLGLFGLTAWNLTRSTALADAQRAYGRGDLVGCLGRALDHLDRRPYSRDAALLAARCLSRLDYSGEAETYYRRGGSLLLGDLQIRAYGLARGPDPERAIPAFQEILDRSPENITALRRLAAVLLAQNDTKQLLALSERLGRIKGGEVVGLMLRGVVHHNDKNPQQAVAAFEKVLELDPELTQMPAARALFWNHLTDDLASSGRLDDAARYLSQLLKTSPNARLMDRLGQTFFLQGELDQAERCFRQAAEWDPAAYRPRVQLAQVALQRREPARALEHLNQARQLAPREYDVLYTLASVYRQLGRAAEADRIQEAIRELRQAPAPSPRAAPGTWPRYAL
jgi:tetratricopeptide (TPR) repeat protein